MSRGSRKNPAAARSAEEETGKEVANENWMSHEKEVGCWRRKTTHITIFPGVYAGFTLMLESVACNSCKVLKLIKTSRADGCFSIQ